jgi:hypothetical protein
MNTRHTRHSLGRCPRLTNFRPVGAAVVRGLEFFGVSPERVASQQPRATPSATEQVRSHKQCAALAAAPLRP